MRRRFVSSEQNPEVKRIKALRDRRSVRHAERLCIVEGPRFVADVARLAPPQMLVVAESRADEELPPAADVVIVPDPLFAAISDTATPQGMLAVCPFPTMPSPDSTPLLLVADGIQDPGNLGAMIRTAAAFGATGVVCPSGTVDPFAPKVIRSAAAAQWSVPILLADAVPDVLPGVGLLIADGNAEIAIDQIDLTAPAAIAVGSEGHGVGSVLRSLPHTLVAIPMSGEVESLNAGIAASIVLYEAQRQRRSGTGC